MVKKLPNKILIAILTTVFCYSSNNAQTNNLRVNHLTLEDGIPSEIINCIHQDSLGFIWLGTSNGLVKYDGYRMTVFNSSILGAQPSPGPWIHSIAEDKDGNIWTAGSRLSRYSRAEDAFRNFRRDSIIPFPHVDVNVEHRGYHFAGFNGSYSRLFIDKKENLWIGTYSYGLYRLDLKKFRNGGELPEVELIFHDLGLEGSQSINSIAEDGYGNIWVATNNALVKLFAAGNEFKIYQSSVSVGYNSKNHFTDIIVEKDNLWLATFGHGICQFNTSEQSFNYTSLKSVNDPDYYTNSVYSISMDKNHTIWCGMQGDHDNGGIVAYNVLSGKIERYLYDPLNEFGPGPYFSWVNDILIDNTGVIWCGYRIGPLDRIIPERNYIKFASLRDFEINSIQNPTVHDFQPLSDSLALVLTGGGILMFNSESGQFTPKYSGLNSRIKEMKSEKSLLLDSKGTVWIGYADGVLRFSPSEQKTEVININYSSKVSVIVEDQDDIYWISTFGDGLIKFDDKTKQVRQFKHNPKDPLTIKDDYLNCIYSDNSGGIWLGSNGGWLTRFNKESETAENYNFNASAIENLGPLNEDKVWLATARGGFVIFDKKSKTIEQYGVDKGVPNGILYGAVEDKSGFYWIISSNAVTKYDPESGTLHNFNIGNSTNSLYKSYFEYGDAEVVYLTAVNGFYYFHPEELKLNTTPPKVVLSNFKVFNNSLVIGSDSILTKHINVAERITLPHNKNDFTIEYAALHYVDSENNQYKYILENYDKNWREAGSERSARYTSLSPGDFTFKVAGSNSDGIWKTEPAILQIKILPPWWQTWWAYFIYVLVFGLTSYFLYALQRKRANFRHLMELKDFETLKLKEVDEMKSRFFANISHEFRTPLTLIKGPAERLLENEKDEESRKIYKTILKNSSRLLNLINELLDLSKLESGKMKLSAQKSDIVSFTKGIAMSFESLAEKKGIQITLSSTQDMIDLYFDKEKMQRILTNLISNALKFTPESGIITISLEEKKADQQVSITVADTGKGIPPEELSKVFDRFYQVTDNENSGEAGTGIGLSLTKELVEMHHGRIEAKSEPGSGAEFIILFPAGKNHLSDDEIIYTDTGKSESESFDKHDSELITEQNADLPLLLVVEDNDDVREFIISIIQSEYRVVEATNGKQGYDKAVELIPDLIISDIMMPRMAGDEMCDKIKKEEITSHIPIILLTAKASGEDKIGGLKTGADDYLIKPFNSSELLARIKNLINLRRKLREKYLRDAEINPTDAAVTSVDRKFIEKVIKIVDENISNTEFSVEKLAADLAVSRAQLYRKFTTVLGEKPNEFIQKYRIKRAAQLIRQNFGNITEIAYEVGFQDVSYFSKCFKKIYKSKPLDFQNLYKDK